MKLVNVPYMHYSRSLGRTVLVAYYDPLSEGGMSPEFATLKQMMDVVIPAFREQIDKLREENAELKQQVALAAQPAPAIEPEPEDAELLARAQSLIDEVSATATVDGGATTELPADEPIMDEPFMPGDTIPVVTVPEPAPAPQPAPVDLTDARTFINAKAKSWFAFGKRMKDEDLQKLAKLTDGILIEGARFAELKMQGDAGADGAIAELAQSLPTVAMQLGLGQMKAAREKLNADLREIVGWLVMAGRGVITAAIVAV